VLVDCAICTYIHLYLFTHVSQSVVERSEGIFARLGNRSPRTTDEEMKIPTKSRNNLISGQNYSYATFAQTCQLTNE